MNSDKPAARETTKNNFCGSFFRKSSPSLLRLLADIWKTTRTTSTTYNNLSSDKPAARETTKNNFCGSFFRKSSPSLLRLLADIWKTTGTTSTIFYNASPGQHAMRDTILLQGKQQNTTKRTVCTVYILLRYLGCKLL